MLQRIVALLFALADLAEAASLRSAPARRLVLWFLYRAEAAARGLVLSTYGPVKLDTPRPPFSNNEPADALWLANCLRVLALLLDAVDPDDLPDERHPCRFVSRLFITATFAAFTRNSKARLFPDTS